MSTALWYSSAVERFIPDIKYRTIRMHDLRVGTVRYCHNERISLWFAPETSEAGSVCVASTADGILQAPVHGRSIPYRAALQIFGSSSSLRSLADPFAPPDADGALVRHGHKVFFRGAYPQFPQVREHMDPAKENLRGLDPFRRDLLIRPGRCCAHHVQC